MFKTGDLIEPDPSHIDFDDEEIKLLEREIGQPPWIVEKIKENFGWKFIKIQGYGYELIAQRFLLFIPAEKTEVDNWKNGLDLL